MARKSHPTEDDWKNVTDARKRKQIQDRLAQRARRKRLREAKTKTEQAFKDSETPETAYMQDGDYQIALVSHYLYEPPPVSSNGAFDTTISTVPSIDRGLLPLDLGNMFFDLDYLDPMEPLVQQVPSIIEQPSFPMTVYSALFINGQILGLTCGTSVAEKSVAPHPGVPPPLRPTVTQLMTIHPRFIDRFPSARVRDNLIAMCCIIDDEELIQDLFVMPSFQIEPGFAPWDARGWRIQKPFADKWGYIFGDIP